MGGGEPPRGAGRGAGRPPGPQDRRRRRRDPAAAAAAVGAPRGLVGESPRARSHLDAPGGRRARDRLGGDAPVLVLPDRLRDPLPGGARPAGRLPRRRGRPRRGGVHRVQAPLVSRSDRPHPPPARGRRHPPDADQRHRGPAAGAVGGGPGAERAGPLRRGPAERRPWGPRGLRGPRARPARRRLRALLLRRPAQPRARRRGRGRRARLPHLLEPHHLRPALPRAHRLQALRRPGGGAGRDVGAGPRRAPARHRTRPRGGGGRRPAPPRGRLHRERGRRRHRGLGALQPEPGVAVQRDLLAPHAGLRRHPRPRLPRQHQRLPGLRRGAGARQRPAVPGTGRRGPRRGPRRRAGLRRVRRLQRRLRPGSSSTR